MSEKNESLESLLRQAFGAYLFLRSAELTTVSGTARLLQESNLLYLANRVRDELDELRGAVEGTHIHQGGEADIILEASQALYWLMLLGIAAHDNYDDLALHSALSDPTALSLPPMPALDDPTARHLWVQATCRIVGALCHQAKVDLRDVIQYDLRSLRSKIYLATYWEKIEGDSQIA